MPISIILHRMYSLAFLLRRDRCEIPKRVTVTVCRAPSRLSLSIGCHLVICSLRDTPRACLRRGNVSLLGRKTDIVSSIREKSRVDRARVYLSKSETRRRPRRKKDWSREEFENYIHISHTRRRYISRVDLSSGKMDR